MRHNKKVFDKSSLSYRRRLKLIDNNDNNELINVELKEEINYYDENNNNDNNINKMTSFLINQRLSLNEFNDDDETKLKSSIRPKSLIIRRSNKSPINNSIIANNSRDDEFEKRKKKKDNLLLSSSSSIPRSLCILLTFIYISLSIILLISSNNEYLAQANSKFRPINNVNGYSSFLINDNNNNFNEQDYSNINKHNSIIINNKFKRHSSISLNQNSFTNSFVSKSKTVTNNNDSGNLLVCPDSWQQHSTQCYRFFQQRRSWSRAKETCENYGAQLALVLDYQENNFTGQLASLQLIGMNNPVLIGDLANNKYSQNNQFNRQQQQQQQQHNGPNQRTQVYASDERSYWIGFKTIDKLETNTLESAANTFVSKYLGFWDYDEPKTSQGECVKATIRHETLANPSGSSSAYKLSPSQGLVSTGKF